MAKLQSQSSRSRKSGKGTGGGIGQIIGTLVGLFVVVIGAIISIFSGSNAGGGTTPAAPVTNVAIVATQRGTAVPVPTTRPGAVQSVSLPKGFGAKKGFWEVYFTAPVNTTNRREFTGGTDTVVASLLDAAARTVDIAAFEWDNEVINAALLRAIGRGVRVRMVADNEHTIDDDGSLIAEIEAEGVPIVYDNRSPFMHNKFMIIDGTTILTGSTNWTMNGVYRNNNNLLVLRNVPQIVQTYQTEFEQMFTRKVFGPRKTPSNPRVITAPNNTPVEILFGPEDDVIGRMVAAINAAQSNVRFMAFSFTQDPLGEALLQQAAAGIDVRGVFERTGSETQFSEMTRLFCAGLDVRQDGYGGIMHHKVIIIDNRIVMTGSFNFSQNAAESNDENLAIINDPDLAAQYLAEFDRVQRIATPPTGLVCN